MNLLDKHYEIEDQLFNHVGWKRTITYRIIGNCRYSWKIEGDHIKVFEKNDIYCRSFYYKIYEQDIDGFIFRGEDLTMIMVLLEGEICSYFGDNTKEVK